MQPSAFESLLILYARRFPIQRGKLRVIDQLWRAASGDNCDKRVAVLKYGGLRMRCDLNEMLHRQLYFFGTYFSAEHLLGCWQREATSARVILDVGANAGIFSLAALAAAPQAEVHAFEPTPEIADGLRHTATMNHLKQLHVHEFAVWRSEGHAALRRFRGELGTNEGMNFVTASRGDPAEEIVETICLDRFCGDRGLDHIDLLKIDIQGNEHQALEGAAGLLGAGRVAMVFTELNWTTGSDTCPATESIRILERAGYCFAKPDATLKWRRSGTWMRELSDVVARRMPSGTIHAD